ncbi:MAG: hypothetical protein FJ388_18180, partial [Verrucomicrobia bacterium]|nr:hypothetical protein [Verrucomicrobiota bacterium]
NVREKFPNAPVIAVKIFPAHAPGNRFYEDIKKTNAALDALKLDSDPKVTVLDLWNDMVNADGTLRKELFTPDNIHLTQDGGYALYASRLKPVVEKLLGCKLPAPSVAQPVAADPKERRFETAAVTRSPENERLPQSPGGGSKPPLLGHSPRLLTSAATGVLKYPYAPYNEGKLDPQIAGWPLTDAERAWVAKPEYNRKPGHEVQKHLPQMWAVTPTAAHWKTKDGSAGNLWIEHHATIIGKVQASKGHIDIALIGDSITQGWGGGFGGAPFNAAWQKHFASRKTVNLGIGGDRTENVLWRLDHGALDGAAPKVAVLLIGVNNAPLVHANGVPAAVVAQGIKLCVENLRLRCPKSRVVVVKILPAFKPGEGVGAAVQHINTALDTLKLDNDPQIHLLDLWSDFTNADGSLTTALYSDGHLHLGLAGYEIYAGKLKPVVERLLR